MEKKQHQKNRTGKKRGKKPVARIRSLSRSRKLQKKISIKKPIKTGKKTSKKRSIKKPIFKKPAAFKKRPKKQGLLRRPKNATKPEVPFIDSEKLPDRYNSTDVTLMVRDPYWIHAFWETTPSSVREVQKKIGAPFKKSVYTLRVHDITIGHSNEENSRASFDIDVDPKARNWYINLWRDNVTYFADFGIRTPKGAFYPLARSNTVTTPRATMSEMPDVTWMKVEEGALIRMLIIRRRGRKHRSKKSLLRPPDAKNLPVTSRPFQSWTSRREKLKAPFCHKWIRHLHC